LHCHVIFSFAHLRLIFFHFARFFIIFRHLIERRAKSSPSVTVERCRERSADAAAHLKFAARPLLAGHRKHDGFRALSCFSSSSGPARYSCPQHAKHIFERAHFSEHFELGRTR